jgi:GntR family transcriptional regulator
LYTYKLKLNRNGGTPVFRQISDALRSEIEAGTLRQGDVIPSENTLSASLKVSRMTVRAAVDQLVQQGLLVRQQGRGTAVARRPITKSANVIGFMSFSEEMRARGLKPSSQVIEFTDKIADSAIAAQLGLPSGAHVIYLERVRLANGEPMALERCHLPYARFAGLTKFDLTRRSLYDILEAEFDTRPDRCEETVEAMVLDASDAQLLGVKRGMPALRVQRITQDMRGNLIEAEQTTFRADRYRMVFMRRR